MRYTDQSPIQRLFADVKDYLNIQKKIALTTVSKKGGDVVYAVVLGVALLVIGWFFLMIFSMALGFGIGVLVNSTFWGFMIVAGLYLLLGALIWIKRESLLRAPILSMFLKFVEVKPEDYEQEEVQER